MISRVLDTHRIHRPYVFLMNYHLIWCPKRRCKVLEDRVRARLEELLRE